MIPHIPPMPPWPGPPVQPQAGGTDQPARSGATQPEAVAPSSGQHVQNQQVTGAQVPVAYWPVAQPGPLPVTQQAPVGQAGWPGAPSTPPGGPQLPLGWTAQLQVRPTPTGALAAQLQLQPESTDGGGRPAPQPPAQGGAQSDQPQTSPPQPFRPVLPVAGVPAPAVPAMPVGLRNRRYWL